MSNIPLLLSKEDIKRFNFKIDMQNDTAEILGKEVNLDTTSSGHYCIALQSCEIPLEKFALQSVKSQVMKSRKLF